MNEIKAELLKAIKDAKHIIITLLLSPDDWTQSYKQSFRWQQQRWSSSKAALIKQHWLSKESSIG